MRNRTLSLALFTAVAIIQLYVPAKMILDQETIIADGKEYKFRTAPIDPNDPFRGKYITLSFDENTIKVADAADWVVGETVYALLATDDQGFAKIQSVSKDKPNEEREFLETKVRQITTNEYHQLTLDYPFDRLYLEESKAADAEIAYRESAIDSSQVAYALVAIKDGQAVLKDVLVNGVPVKELVEQNQEEKDQQP